MRTIILILWTILAAQISDLSEATLAFGYPVLIAKYEDFTTFNIQGPIISKVSRQCLFEISHVHLASMRLRKTSPSSADEKWNG